MKNKKGVNQFVATILLIAFVVIIIVLIILWARKVTQERAEKEGALAALEVACQSTKMNLDIIPNGVKVTNSGSVDFHGLFIIQDVGNEQIVDKLYTKFIPGDSFDLVYGGDCDCEGCKVEIGQLCLDAKKVSIIPGQQAQGYTDAPLLGCEGEKKEVEF